MPNSKAITQAQAQILGSLKRIPRVAYLYGVTFWLALAFFAYGMAMKDFVSKWRTKDNVPVGEVTGRVTWADRSWLSPEIRFRVDSRSETFHFPKEFIASDATAKLVGEFVKKDTTLFFKFPVHDLTVLDIVGNPNTPYQKQVLAWSATNPLYYQIPTYAAKKASLYFSLGWLMLGLGVLAHLGSRWMIPRKS